MPSPDVIATFLDSATARLQAPISRYYDVVDQFGAGSLQATIAASLTRAEEERVLRQLHIEAGVLGSANDMSPAQRAELRTIIGSDETYMRGFMDALPSLTRTQALNRAALYGGTVKNTVQQVETLDLPLPVRPKDSSLDCTWHCKCGLNIVYLFGQQNVDVFWLLDQTGIEHCDSCLRLAATWRPLRIRNGVIVGAKAISDHDFAHLKAALERFVAA